jgi:hypothetical protein
VATGAAVTTATGGNWCKLQLTSRNWWQLVHPQQPQLVATGASRNSQAATGGNWCSRNWLQLVQAATHSRNWWQLVQLQQPQQPQLVATGASRNAQAATGGNWCSRNWWQLVQAATHSRKWWQLVQPQLPKPPQLVQPQQPQLVATGAAATHDLERLAPAARVVMSCTSWSVSFISTDFFSTDFFSTALCLHVCQHVCQHEVKLVSSGVE